jgi:uncharacterized membrane protein YfcA
MNFDAKDILLFALSLFLVWYLYRLTTAFRANRADPIPGTSAAPNAPTIATGFVTNFFDTLGIGSFATTTAIFRQFRMVRDEFVPGTLNVGHTIGAIMQAFIFTKLVPVEARTLILMIGAAVVGAFLGAGVVSNWPRRRIQIGMGVCLLGAAALLTIKVLNVGPAGGDLLALTGPKLVIAIAVNMTLGALMTLGIGLYAPCLILVAMLGMDPHAAFPIMMGSCAFLMPVASDRFMRKRRYDPGASVGLVIGSIFAVPIAAFIVQQMNLVVIMWLVIVVVVYAAVGLLRAALREAPAVAEGVPTP